jgi:hypothetical protein
MNDCPTCRHIKPDGTYCGSPALRDRKYCHYHLKDRGRRLRRARALRDNVPYRLDIPLLDSPAAVRLAITEIVQAMGTGQLDHRTGGKMLYGIQMANSFNRRAAQAAAEAQAEAEAGCPVQASGSELERGFSPTGDLLRVEEYSQFEQEFGLKPGADVDAEIDRTLRKADEEIELRQANNPMPAPPPGVRLGSPQYRIYREEVYQALNMELNSLKRELRDYHEMKRKESEKRIAEVKKEALSAAPPPKPLATSA